MLHMQEQNTGNLKNVSSQLYQIIASIAITQARAFETGSVESFMQWFDLDLVSDYYMKRWFMGYAVKVASPLTCQVEIQDLQQRSADEVSCSFIFHLTYKTFEEETATFQNLLRSIPDQSGWRIMESYVQLKQKEWPDQPPMRPLSHIVSSYKGEQVIEPWWEQNELTSIARASTDHLKASLYARAIAKSTRHRSTHPEIDSAVIAASMASTRACRLAFSFETTDPAFYLQQLHAYAPKLMVGKNYEDLRQANRSYFPARELSLQPLYALDEIFAFWDQNPQVPVEVNCPEITAFYVTMLRLLGLAPWHIFVLIQPFHYLSFLRLTRGYYILSGHDIIPMDPHRLYSDSEVTRIVSPAFYLDQSGLTNMPVWLENRVKDGLATSLPIFSLPTGRDYSDTLPTDAEPTYSIRSTSTPEQLSMAIRRHIFTMSKLYPASPFTWAKYVYQTLLVPQPQAYLIWSLKAPTCKTFAQQQSTFDAALGWMRENLTDGSIFEESDRIMTADQVINHRCGSAQDRAMLLYTAARLLNKAQAGGIVLTTKSCYVSLHNEDGQVIYDCQALQPVPTIEGKVNLAFDDQGSYDPLRADHSKRGPLSWLERIEQAF